MEEWEEHVLRRVEVKLTQKKQKQYKYYYLSCLLPWKLCQLNSVSEIFRASLSKNNKTKRHSSTGLNSKQQKNSHY